MEDRDTLSLWRIREGDYGATTFMNEQRKLNELPLDQVYTAKTLFGLLKMIQDGEISRGSTALMVHTGGLQGAVSAKQIL